jgi:hypothetical protein
MAKSRFRRGCVAAAAVIIGGAPLAQSASAQTEPPGNHTPSECARDAHTFTNTMNFTDNRTPGSAATVKIALCLVRTPSGAYTAVAVPSWSRVPGVPPLQFEKFVIEVRLEHSDARIKKRKCDRTEFINLVLSQDSFRNGQECHSPTVPKLTGERTWSADGRVIYNVDNDGRGVQIWRLHGSGLIGS